MQRAPQDNQLMSKHRVLGFKPQLRLEWRGQDGQHEAEQPDHSASLGDSITSATRTRFSVHTPISMPSLRSPPWILGAPHSGLAMLISRISRRISNDTVGRPQRCRDFQRQYDLKPARCQRMTVSGFTIVSALMVFGTKRYSPTKIRRSMALKASRFGRCRRWMLS